jgi:glycosyltransferase involved in cell wall biosynthesis
VRILIASEVYPPRAGGAGWSSRALVLALRDAGHEVRVVSSAAGEMKDGVVERRFAAPEGAFRRFAAARAFARLLDEEAAAFRPDVVHAQHVLSALGALSRGPDAAKRTVVTVRDHWPVCFWSTRISRGALCPACTTSNMFRCVQGRVAGPAAPLAVPYMSWDLASKRRALARAGAVVAVSEAVAAELRAANTPRVHAIPNIVDAAEVSSIAAAAPGIDLPARYLIFVGKLEANKGADLLMPALAKAATGLPVVVLGSGEREATVREQARAAAIDARFPGWTDRADVLRAMARAEALVFPSTWPEPFSRVLLEALALGVPIAAMDTGGTAELVENGASGLLARSTDELAACVRGIVSSASLRGDLGRNARERARSFSPASLVPRYEALYRSLAS